MLWRCSHAQSVYTYVHFIVRSCGPLLDTSAIRGENMKHSDYKKGTSPNTGVARPVYTTVAEADAIRVDKDRLTSHRLSLSLSPSVRTDVATY